MRDETLQYLSAKYNEKIKDLENDLGNGTAKDHGDYKYAAGIIRGLKVANNELLELSDKMKEDDND